MARIVKSGLIQLSLAKTEGEGTIPEIMEAMLQKHIPYIEEAGRQGVQILCFSERYSIRLIFVQDKIALGILHQLRRFQDQPQNACKFHILRNTIWLL